MKKIVLAALCACGFASAAGDLWGVDTDLFPSLQVQVPQVVQCWADDPDPVDSQCYTTTGGWWFGYTDGPATTTQVKLGNSYTNFGEGVSITDPEDGSSLLPGSALEIKFTAGPGEAEAPTISGIGFNHMGNESGTSIENFGGYCITYSLTGEALQMELGWNESQYGYDTWYVELPVSANRTTKVFAWSAFDKDGWGTGTGVQAITTATGSAVSLKIRLKNGGGTTKISDFSLYELGRANSNCGGTPIISNNVVVNANLNLNLSGKMLSMTVKEAVPVQIVNLQGAVVHSQVYAPGSKMNLSNLPTGVYMVRVPSLSYSGKIMLK